MLRVPFNGGPREHFVFNVAEQSFEMDIWWQPQTQAWYATIIIDGTTVCTGQRIVAGTPMLRLPTFFEGEIMAVPLDDTATEPGLNDWGTSFELVHVSSVELAELLT